MSAFSEIEQMLLRAIGLNASSIGSHAIATAVRARMQARKIPTPEEYCQALVFSPEELQELIEGVVVPETWFFRDHEPFSVLSQKAREKCSMGGHSGSLVRVLSVPCATGEEPYSVVMALMDAGVMAERFRVDAVDVSLRSLELAKRGIYGNNSFRGNELHFRERYFRRVPEGSLISEVVREQVRFRQGNLLAPNFSIAEGPYDFIFCRNVLIYFESEAQQRAIAALERVLVPEGLLFVGHAEMPLLTSRGFVSCEPARAFVCRKRVPGEASRAPGLGVRKSRVALQPVALPPAKSKAQLLPLPTLPKAKPEPEACPMCAMEDLDAAFRLADLGRLNEARELCQAHLSANPSSARAHYLLGLTCDAIGDEARAAEHYRKAIYLDPAYCEALAHLAALLEKKGDVAAARLFYARASRSASQSGVEF
jgi:chemotaxis protein methyltransferase WspC